MDSDNYSLSSSVAFTFDDFSQATYNNVAKHNSTNISDIFFI